MSLADKYTITRDYIPVGNSRPGVPNEGISFIVAHDTGNPGSSAYANRSYFARNVVSASAHTFIDDDTILEIIPLEEKAWHVRYEVPADDRMFGGDANDKAISVELAWGGDIDFQEAYNRYVWYIAYLSHKFNLNPLTDIVAHSRLDPTRRSDPENALHRYGITWSEFLSDVNDYYNHFYDAAESVKVEAPKKKVKGASTPIILSYGDEGETVKKVQQLLIDAGMDLSEYGADGIYGMETTQAVRFFQAKYGLKVDGIVGPITLGKLRQVTNNPNMQKEGRAVRQYPGHYVMIGDRGGDVTAIQRAVNVKPDGIFGPNTEAAVKDYQRRHDLAVDGIVGPITWNVMF
jgi:N-acetylmuramoyl-L-alanine amidase